MSNWNRDMSRAPKDKPILALCCDECESDVCGYHTGNGTSLCLYHGHAKGLSKVSDGPHVLEWGGSWSDTWEDGGGYMPDWWFLCGSEFEIAANPIAWMGDYGLYAPIGRSL